MAETLLSQGKPATASSVTNGDGGFDLTASARYVRLSLSQRATTYGYSLWEFGVHR